MLLLCFVHKSFSNHPLILISICLNFDGSYDDHTKTIQSCMNRKESPHVIIIKVLHLSASFHPWWLKTKWSSHQNWCLLNVFVFYLKWASQHQFWSLESSFFSLSIMFLMLFSQLFDSWLFSVEKENKLLIGPKQVFFSVCNWRRKINK